MRPLSEATARVTGQNFKRKYIALGKIVNSWSEIVGEKLATKAQPVKIRYRKYKAAQTEKPEVLLDIAVSSAEATLLHYQKDLILERINQIFGERLIDDIRFVSTPSNEGMIRRKKIKTPLTGQEKTTLSHMLTDMLGSVSDPDIKDRLISLGESILTKDKEQ